MNATSPAHPPSQARPRRHVESWCRPADHSCPHHCEPPQSCRNQPRDGTKSLIHGFRPKCVAPRIAQKSVLKVKRTLDSKSACADLSYSPKTLATGHVTFDLCALQAKCVATWIRKCGTAQVEETSDCGAVKRHSVVPIMNHSSALERGPVTNTHRHSPHLANRSKAIGCEKALSS